MARRGPPTRGSGVAFTRRALARLHSGFGLTGYTGPDATRANFSTSDALRSGGYARPRIGALAAYNTR